MFGQCQTWWWTMIMTFSLTETQNLIHLSQKPTEKLQHWLSCFTLVYVPHGSWWYIIISGWWKCRSQLVHVSCWIVCFNEFWGETTSTVHLRHWQSEGLYLLMWLRGCWNIPLSWFCMLCVVLNARMINERQAPKIRQCQSPDDYDIMPPAVL